MNLKLLSSLKSLFALLGYVFNCFKSLTALPGPPAEVRASEITATTVRLAWTYSGTEEPQYYVIQYKPKYANQVQKIDSNSYILSPTDLYLIISYGPSTGSGGVLIEHHYATIATSFIRANPRSNKQ